MRISLARLRAIPAALALLAARPALADEPRLELTWHAPPGCPSAATVRARVDALLGAPARLAEPMRVSARLTARPDGWQLELTAHTLRGRLERQLLARDCATLGEATALVVALAIDPAAAANLDPAAVAILRTTTPETATPHRPATQPSTARGKTPAPPPAASGNVPSTVMPSSAAPGPPSPSPEPALQRPAILVPAPPQAPPPVPPSPTPLELAPPPTILADPPLPPPPAPPPPRPPISAAFRAAVGLGLGPQPTPAGLLTLAAALGIGRARLELLAGRWTSSPTRLAPGIGADFTLTTGALRGCGVPGRRILEFPLCLGLELGALRGRPLGLDDPRPGSSLWAALTFGAALAVVPLRRLAVFLALDGHLALARPRFLVDGAGDVWRPALAGVRAQLGLEVRFFGGPR